MGETKRTKMIITNNSLPFQYISEKKLSGMTGFSGLPLYLELATKIGLAKNIEQSLCLKKRGWSDTEIILSLIMLNLAGGDCISDIDRLEEDIGLRTLIMRSSMHGMSRKERRDYEKRWRIKKKRGAPCNSAIHRYLSKFHSPEEEKKRIKNKAFIPAPNSSLQAIIGLNRTLIESIQQCSPFTQATLDQDATLISTNKNNAFHCYKGYRAYQPFNTYWAEHGMILHTEFRDGNVPAGFEQRRLLEEALNLLPAIVKKVFFRSDSAAFQKELLRYCAEGKSERFGVIEFAIAMRISAAFKKEVDKLPPEAWKSIYKKEPDGTIIKTNQEWAEVCFAFDCMEKGLQQTTYRYLAIREAMKHSKKGKKIETKDLPFQTIQNGYTTYKLFAVVTNRNIDGGEIIQWHRERCGKSEQVHSAQKGDLAGGQLPSNLFGVNAAWWTIMALSFNLNRLLQLAALPEKFKEKRMKALRFNIIQMPGRVINHARQVYLKVGNQAHKLYQSIRKKINQIPLSPVLLGKY